MFEREGDDMDSAQLVDGVAHDIRDAIRRMRRAALTTVVAVLTLGAGLALNIGVFGVANAVLFKGFAVVDRNDRILYIGTQKNGRGCCASYPDVKDWRSQTQSFEDVGAVADLQVTIAVGVGAPEHYDATQVTANTFRLLHVAPALGRDFTATDEPAGAAPVAILAYDFWQRQYGSDGQIVGRTLRINGNLTTIVGVMPQGFAFPQNQQLWVPLQSTPEFEQRGRRGLWFAFGRLRRDVTFERARAELAVIGQRLARVYPETNEGWTPTPRTFAQFFIGVNAPLIYGVLWAAVSFVLLIACGNFANLQIARTHARSREIAVRLALGASRWDIARQLIVESVLLSTLGGAVGCWFASYGLQSYAGVANPPTRSWAEHLLDFSLDWRAWLYAAGISLATGLVFGLVAASRFLRFDVDARLKDAGRGIADDRGTRRLSATLVIVQLALSVVLVSGATAMFRSFLALYTADIGASTHDVVTGLINLPPHAYRDASARRSFFARLTATLQNEPGVESVTIASTYPASGGQRVTYEVSGESVGDDRQRPTTLLLTIGSSYFQTFRTPILSGREFTERDDAFAVPVAIVNEQFARTNWPGEDAVGKRLRAFVGDTPTTWLTVVGVSGNILQDVTRQQRDPIVYVAYRQRPIDSMWVFARTRVPPVSLTVAFRRQTQAIDRDLPIWLGPYPLSERLDGTGPYWNTRTESALLLMCAVLGLLLASIGLYAVVAHGVARRTREIGVRMAIGATTRQIIGLILAQAVWPVSIGIVLGLMFSIGTNRLLQSEFVNTSPNDPITYLGTAGVLLASAAIGCFLPTRRATRIDPILALRSE
jgi:putative ABC transport system permease protein